MRRALSSKRRPPLEWSWSVEERCNESQRGPQARMTVVAGPTAILKPQTRLLLREGASHQETATSRQYLAVNCEPIV
jgi:hypothetical protein